MFGRRLLNGPTIIVIKGNLSHKIQETSRLDFFSATEADSKKWLGFLSLKCNGLPEKLKLEWWRNRKGILDGKQIEKVDIEEHIV
ncbi:hypothetical protein OROMI_008154 [Orobanche minor]